MKHDWILISQPTEEIQVQLSSLAEKKLKKLFGIKLNMTKEQDSEQRPWQIIKVYI